MKNIILLSLLFLTACSGIGTSYAPQAAANVATASPKPQAQATSTPVPSPTIGYESTIAAKQNELDEIKRANAQITAEYERRIQEQLQMTAVRDAQIQDIYRWTQQAAQTVIPLTATQQAVVNTQVVAANTLAAAKITMTNDYPSLIKKTEDARNYAKYGETSYIVGIVAMIILVLLMVAGIAAIVKYWVLHPETMGDDKEETEEPQTVTRINIYTDNGAHSEFHGVPCSPDQLTEFADKTVNKGVTIGINNWEGEDTLWTRDYYIPFRKWLESAGLAVSFKKPNGAIQYAPVEPNLSDFLRGWLATRQLPSGYEFQEQTKQAESDYGGELVPIT